MPGRAECGLGSAPVPAPGTAWPVAGDVRAPAAPGEGGTAVQVRVPSQDAPVAAESKADV